MRLPVTTEELMRKWRGVQCGLARLLGSPPLHGGVIKYPRGLLNPGGVHNSFYCERVEVGVGGGVAYAVYYASKFKGRRFEYLRNHFGFNLPTEKEKK